MERSSTPLPSSPSLWNTKASAPTGFSTFSSNATANLFDELFPDRPAAKIQEQKPDRWGIAGLATNGNDFGGKRGSVGLGNGVNDSLWDPNFIPPESPTPSGAGSPWGSLGLGLGFSSMWKSEDKPDHPGAVKTPPPNPIGTKLVADTVFGKFGGLKKNGSDQSVSKFLFIEL